MPLKFTIKPSAVLNLDLKDGTVPLVRRLVMENFKDYASSYAIAGVFMILVAVTTALSAWIMRDVVESLFLEKNFHKTIGVALAVVAIFLVKGFATFGQQITLSRVGNAIVARIQMRIYEKVIRQGGDFYARFPSNDLVTRMESNAQDARNVMDLVVISFGRDLLTVLGLIVVMLLQDFLLSLIALVVVPPVIIVVSSLVRRVKKVAKQRFISSTKIISAMQETVSGIKIVKSFGMEKAMQARMGAAVDDVRIRNNKIATLTARTSPLMETLGGICIGLMILYAGWQISAGDETPAGFMAFLTALLLAYEPAKRLARLHIGLEAGLVGVRLMYEILDRPLEIEDHLNAKKLSVTAGSIDLKNVSFSYREEAESDLRVLSDLNLVAEGGKTTALVGASGSGKTTIFNLLQRFYDVAEGTIQIDGQDIKNVTLESLRANVAFVSQDTFLFAGSVIDNIRFGRPDATFEQVEQAVRDANAYAFIQELEQGYETQLGENGASLSGGQRQRVAIARALLKDAPIVLLDEATSALDAESEKLIQEAFDRLKDGRTTLVIAHRLSTIRDADQIHVMRAGQIVESGVHTELMANNSVYRHLHDLQFKIDAEPAA